MAVTRANPTSRYLSFGGVALLLGAIVIGLIRLTSGGEAPPQTIPPVVMLKILPPPPPPPPPPKTEPPPEAQKMTETPKMIEPIKPLQSSPPKMNAPAPGPLGLDAKGAGPGVDLPAGNGNGEGNGSGDGEGGSITGWYASVLTSALQETLSADSRFDYATGQMTARIWLDADGNPTRVEIVQPFADASLNDAFRDDVLHRRKRFDPPPKECPQPVTIRLGMSAPSA